MSIEDICNIIVDTAFKLHIDIGSGLLESAYEAILAAKLESLGLSVERQVPIDIEYDGVQLSAAFRLDLLVENCVISEKNCRKNFASACEAGDYVSTPNKYEPRLYN